MFYYTMLSYAVLCYDVLTGGCLCASRWILNGWEVGPVGGSDEHLSLVGGNLVISSPVKSKHSGKYICLAQNAYGTVMSREATVTFGCKSRRVAPPLYFLLHAARHVALPLYFLLHTARRIAPPLYFLLHTA